jgi:hypothetical protein
MTNKFEKQQKKFILLIKKQNIVFLRFLLSMKDFQAPDKPPALQRERPAFQNIKFQIFSSLLSSFLDQTSTASPDPSIKSGSGFELLTGNEQICNAHKMQCCGYGSGIRCFFYTWIRDPYPGYGIEKKSGSGSGIWDEHPKSYFRQLRNNVLG